MSEQLGNPTFARLMQNNLDEFYPVGSALREDYVARGVIPTNNFGNYLASDLLPEGSIERMAYDLKHAPFGRVLEAYQQEYPEQWENARQAVSRLKELMRAHLDAAATQDTAKHIELGQLRDEAREHSDQLLSDLYLQVAPRLEEAGFNPLDACI
jgi:hypothetical protein